MLEPSRDRITPPKGRAAPAGARRIVRNAMARAGGEVIGKLASLAFFVVMARTLGTDGFGDFMFALALTTLLIAASGFGTEELIAREVARDRGTVHRWLSDVVVIKGISSVALVLGAVAITYLARYPADLRLAVVLVGLGAAAENLGRTWYAVFQAHERQELVSVALVVQRVTTAVVGVAVLLAGGGLIAASAIFLGGALIGAGVSHLLLRRYVVRPIWRVDRSRWVQIVRTGVPIGLAAVLFAELRKLDLLLLSFFRGGSHGDVAYYGAAYRLIEATMFLSWAFAGAVLPWFARHRPGALVSQGRAYGLALKAVTVVLLPIAILFTTLAGPLVELLYGERYDDAVLPLRLLGPITVLYGINSLAVTILIARNRPYDFTRLLVLVVVFNLSLNAVLIPVYGASGAALSAAASAAILAALGIWGVATVVGKVDIARSFATPVVGGLVMVGAMLALPASPLVAAVLGVVSYGVGVLAVEWVVFRQEDLALAAALARGRIAGEARV